MAFNRKVNLPHNWNGWKWLSVVWLLLITILFVLPGSDIPHDDWLEKVQADKMVHAAFFAVLLLLWRSAFPPQQKTSTILFLASFLYAFAIELIQHYWVTNRTADAWDVLADMIGAVGGLWFWKRYIKK